MRLKPDKYHPRKLFQLNGDGKPYKPIDEKKELLIAAVSFVAGLVFVTLYINRVSLLGLPGTLLSLIYIFSGLICCGVFFLTLIFHFSDVRNLKVRKSYYPDQVIYYIETPTLYDVDKEGVVAKIPVPREVLEILEKEELSGIEIVRKVKEIKHYQNKAEQSRTSPRTHQKPPHHHRNIRPHRRLPARPQVVPEKGCGGREMGF